MRIKKKHETTKKQIKQIRNNKKKKRNINVTPKF